jgi:hypothetical protein
MAKLEELARPAVKDLLYAEEKQLYEELAMRQKAMESDPLKAGYFDVQVMYDGSLMGPKEELVDLGRRIFKKWNAAAHGLVCGAGEVDDQDRKKLQEAFNLKEGAATAVGAVLAGFLVAQLGIAPAIAAVVAAIICKRFFTPVYEEFCASWKKTLAE